MFNLLFLPLPPDTINCVTADGLKFAHPLQHLQKTRDVSGRGEERRGREGEGRGEGESRRERQEES